MSAADTSGPRPRCASCDALRLELTHAQELAQAYAEDAADEHQHVETLRTLAAQEREREVARARLVGFWVPIVLVLAWVIGIASGWALARGVR